MCLDTSQCKNAIIRLLARREHCVFEIHSKLEHRYPTESIHQAVQALQAEGLQSDTRYCEAYIRMRCNKGFGDVRIGYDLRVKQLPEELYAPMLAAIHWDEIAAAVLRKKYPQITTAAQKAKAQRFLVYRGFRYEHYAGLLR